MYIKVVPSAVDPKSTSCSLMYHFPHQCRLTCPHCRGSFPGSSMFNLHHPLLYRLPSASPTSCLSSHDRDSGYSCPDSSLCPIPLSYLPKAMCFPMLLTVNALLLPGESLYSCHGVCFYGFFNTYQFFQTELELFYT